MAKGFNFGDTLGNIYSGTADFGVMYGQVIAVLLIFFSIFLFGLGVYFYRKPMMFPVSIKLLVTKVSPRKTVTYTKDNVPIYNTVYDLVGTSDTCAGDIALFGYTNFVNVGNVIEAYMKPNCESSEASQTPGDSKLLGIILMVVSVITIIFNIIRVIAVKKYKTVAAIQGASGMKNVFNMLT